MNVIGKAHGIELHSPDDAYFSYFNSPYTGHTLGSAIDIYPHHNGWGHSVQAPIDGRVTRIKKMTMGLEKSFPTADYDFGLAIKPESSDSDIVRILHIEPEVSVGDMIVVGDNIGTTIRSRYFNYWTGPHYHVEIMSENSFNRSSQSYHLEIPFEYIPTRSHSTTKEIEFEVKSVSRDHIVGYPKNLDYVSVGQYKGISANHENGKTIGILDGGIPHYKHGGVIGSFRIDVSSKINLEDVQVGSVVQSMHGASYFRRHSPLIPYIDNHELRGLSCFVYTKRYTKRGIPQLVLVPKYYSQFDGAYEEGDVLALELHIDNNRIKTT